MKNEAAKVTVNIYKNKGEWCYVVFSTDGEYDYSDTLDVANNLTDREAIEEAQHQFPDAIVSRVNDTNE